jgi:hypothetical protein
MIFLRLLSGLEAARRDRVGFGRAGTCARKPNVVQAGILRDHLHRPVTQFQRRLPVASSDAKAR